MEAEHISFRNKPTLWLQDIWLTSGDELTYTVLHEFGHALGLLHELQNPNNPIVYDTAEVCYYFYNTYNWKGCYVDEHVLTRITTAQGGAFDPGSVMIYAIPRFLVKNHTEIPKPTKLSVQDRQIISHYYP